jgi:hypothetical protein
VLAAVVAVLAAAAVPAGAAIFFDLPSSGIGRVDLTGRKAKPTLVRSEHSWAVAADRRHVYWARYYCCAGKPQYIGRARLDGTHAQQQFVTLPPLGPRQSGIDSVTVDRQHLYWTDGNVVGRAALDGSHVEAAFITFAPTDQTSQTVSDVRASGGKLYFRVAQYGDGGVARSIGRADVDGTNVVPAFIPGIPLGAGLAADARHLYWDEAENVRAIARANLDGSHVDQHFIDVRAQGLAVGAGHVFWSTFPTGVIGRARADGTHVERRFARGVKRAHTLAVSPG